MNFKNSYIVFFSCLILLAQNAYSICPVAVATGTPSVTCFGSANGSASVQVSGGTGSYSIRWSTGATGTSINFLPAGIYYVNVTDNGTGCTVFDLVVINEPDPLEIVFTVTDVNCNGQATGRITTAVSGGTAPYTYSWSNGATTATLNNVVSGNYTLTVRDSRNCSVTRSTVIFQPASPLQATYTFQNVSCAGNFDGSIDLTVWGGTPPYIYNWNSGQFFTEDLQNIPAGNYSVIATDERGCTITRSVTIVQPPPIAITFVKTDVNCFGGSDGTITLTVNGGTPGYTYQWANSILALGFSTPSISGLPPETYKVTVTDSRNCTGTRIIVVNQPVAPLSVNVAKTNVNCYGGSDGTITLTPAGGTTPYAYNWSNGATTAAINNLAVGNYVFTVTDNNNCKLIDTVNISQPLAPLDNSFTVKNVSCFLGSNGEITAITTGGTVPYSYSWNGGIYSTQTIINVTAGNYNVVITDINGCTFTDDTVVSQPTQLVVTDTVTNVDCYGNATGIIDLTVSGSVPPYSYSWNSSTYVLNFRGQDITGVRADRYFYTVTDFNGCIVTDSADVTQPDSIIITMVVTDVKCFGGNDGSIDVTVTGGVLPYSFQWSNSIGLIPDTTQNISNKPAETYSVVVTDDNSCTASNTAVISQPAAPLTSTLTGTDVNCYGGNDGTADLTVSGSTPPYSFFWSNGSNDEDQYTLFAGIYDVLIVDFNGCQANNSITINQPLTPLSTTIDITHVRCFGESNGAADLTVMGGTPPYRYSWVNSDFVLSVTLPDLLNFPADTYTVTVTDTNSCILKDTAVITEPPLLVITLVGTNIKCFGESTGAIDLTIVGGTTPYQIIWSNGAVTEDLQNLPAGWYSVTVTDANNCIEIDSIELTQPDRPLSTVSETINASCFGENDGRLLIVVDGGTPPYNYLWTNGNTTRIASDLLAGFYEVTVTDTNGCILIDSFEVKQPGRLEPIATITDVTCYGFSDGDIVLNVLGGTPPFRYHWSNSDFQISVITRDLLNVPTDTYTIEISDSNACFMTSTFFLPQPDTLIANADVKGARCYNDSTGSITLNPSGGNIPYFYNWSNGDSTQNIINISAGDYSVTLTDSKGCTLIDTYTIIIPLPIELNPRIAPNSCIDLYDGYILLNPTGGHGTWNYVWSDSSRLNPLTGVKSGAYGVTVTDLLSCSKDTVLFLPQFPIECIEIPNAFTPNGDGINDQWQLGNLDIFPNCVMKVFNKLGRLVFESPKGYSEMWDGNFNGHPLPSDTYYYVMDLANGRKPLSGAVTIVR